MFSQTKRAPPMIPSGDFKNPSEIFSSVAMAAICQDAGYDPIIDKTMLAAVAAAPEGIIGYARTLLLAHIGKISNS